MQEAARNIRNAVHRQVRRHAQNRNNRRAQEQRQRRELAHIRLFRFIGNLLRRVLFPEQADVELNHVRAGQTAGEQVNPFRAAVKHRQRAHAFLRKQLGILHDALVDKRLGHIARESRHAHQTERAHQERKMQNGLFASESAHIIQIQLVQVHVNHTGSHEQDELEERMVDHVEQRTACGKRVLFSQQAAHGDARQDKADLAHRGACQRALEVDGEHRQNRAAEHRDQSQHENEVAPRRACPKDVRRYGDNAKDTGFRQDAGEQRGRRSGCNRMCLRQPDVQREHARLRAEAKQDADARRPDDALIRAGGSRGIQFGNRQRSQLMPEQEQTHQHDHAADDGDRQIGFRRTHRAGRFIVRNPCIRRKGHDLKEHKRRKQIRGQENADRRALRQQEKEVVAVAVAIVMGKVIAGKQRRHQPHHARHQRIQRTEAVQLEAQPETAEAGNRGGKLLPATTSPIAPAATINPPDSRAEPPCRAVPYFLRPTR